MLGTFLYKKWKCVGLAGLLLVVPLTIFSCGGGGIGDGSAGGGIGGTGMDGTGTYTGTYTGVITGFGSVFVNGIEFDTSGALITVDDNDATENELEVGMKVEIEAVGGTAATILFDPEVKGTIDNPVDIANSSFEVLGQTIIVDSATIFKGVNGLVDLRFGDYVEVSGFFDANGDILATFVELATQTVSEVKVKGVVSNYNAGNNSTFMINNLTVDYRGVAVGSLPVINNGSSVGVKGTLQGNTLMATAIELEDSTPPANPGQDMEIEGIIIQVTAPNDFWVNGQRVQTDAMTVFKNGTVNDIAVNVRVDIDGRVDGNGVLIAEEVEFRFLEDKNVKIEGNVESDPVNSTVTIFGITIEVNAGTVLKDENLRSFTFGDIQVGDFLKIGGFVNDSGEVVAGKLERDNDEEYSLKGPVDSTTPNSSLVILGVTVDVSGSGSFEDANGIQINLNTFFVITGQGDIVEVKGNFDTLTGVFIADKVEID